MYFDVDHRWNKTILKQIISVFFMLFFSLQLYAADRGDFQLQRQITIGDGKNAYGKKIYGQGARAVMENVPIKGSTSSSVEQLIKRSIAADKPTATKVGSSMFKRIYSPQAIVGTAVVGGLLTAIGWVMEDGIYVKKIPEDPDQPDPDYQYFCSNGQIVETKNKCGQLYLDDHKKLPEDSQYVESLGSCYGTSTVSCSFKRKGENSYTSFTVGQAIPRQQPVPDPKTTYLLKS